MTSEVFSVGLAGGPGRNQGRQLSNLGGRAVLARLRPNRAIRVLTDPDQSTRRTAVVDRSFDVTPVAGPVTVNTVHPVGHARVGIARGVPGARVHECTRNSGPHHRSSGGAFTILAGRIRSSLVPALDEQSRRRSPLLLQPSSFSRHQK